MAAKTGFEQTQKMEQTQRQVALPSTILVGQMLEKSFEEAVQYVNDELDKNPALEMSSPEPEPNKGNESESFDGNDSTKGNDNNDYDPQYAALRNKHFEFERLMARKMRNQTADRAPRREHGEREGRNYGRKSGDFGGKFERREGRCNRGEGKFGQRDSRGTHEDIATKSAHKHQSRGGFLHLCNYAFH